MRGLEAVNAEVEAVNKEMEAVNVEVEAVNVCETVNKGGGGCK
jgi:hypothetical protein